MYNTAHPFIVTLEQDARKAVPMLGTTDINFNYWIEW
jgi:hypothetical protein